MSFRKTVTYIILAILLLLFYQYIWSDISAFLQKITIFLTAIFIFSFLKDFIFWIFSSITNFWGNILKALILILAFLLSWFYIFTHFSNKNFKENHIEIRNDVRNFFALPTSSPFAKHTAIIVPSSSQETQRSIPVITQITKNEDPLVTLLTQNTLATEKIPTNTVKNIQSFILEYSNNAEKNWKIATQTELYTQDEFTLSRNIQSKIDLKKYEPVARDENETDKNRENINNYLYFRQTPVQVVYPQKYAFKNTTHTTEEKSEINAGLIEEIHTELLYESEKIADIQFEIYNSGTLYEKYKNEFITEPSHTSNTFFIESSTLSSVKYVTFFAGNCWAITFTKEGTNNILDNFYTILIPAVFEAQD